MEYTILEDNWKLKELSDLWWWRYKCNNNLQYIEVVFEIIIKLYQCFSNVAETCISGINVSIFSFLQFDWTCQFLKSLFLKLMSSRQIEFYGSTHKVYHDSTIPLINHSQINEDFLVDETKSFGNCIRQPKKSRKYHLWISSIKPIQDRTWKWRAIQKKKNSDSIYFFRTWWCRFIHAPSQKYHFSSTLQFKVGSGSKRSLQYFHLFHCHLSFSFDDWEVCFLAFRTEVHPLPAQCSN